MSPTDLHARLHHRLNWDELDPAPLRRLIAAARDEDLAGAGLATAPRHCGDVTSSLLPTGVTGRATLTARAPLVVAGLPLVPLILAEFGSQCAFSPATTDGSRLPAGAPLGSLSGPATAMLTLERTLLNFLQMLCGIATETRRYVDALGDSPTRLLDTRKTHPAYRLLAKYAVACAGGWNHRLGLFDRVMLKDNHLAAAGATGGDALVRAVAAARARFPDLPVEVEIDRLDQLEPVLQAGAHVVLLDNFDDDALRAAVATARGRALTEASGGITLERIPHIAHLGLDFISTGATVHQSRWIDIGLDWTS